MDALKNNYLRILHNKNINIRSSGLAELLKRYKTQNTIYSYYYKDHLGSITAVMDGESGAITQAQGFDAWGDICRTYSTTDTSVNKYTGKERDQETGYDYFGARYYDSRIGRWLQTEPLYDKYLQYSPYQYGLLNPVILKDIDGKWIPEYNSKDNSITVKAEEGDTDEDLALQLGISMEQFNKDFESGKSSYDITKFVTPNKEYDPSSENSNCFGFVCFALNLNNNEGSENQENSKDFAELINKKEKTNSYLTGNIAVFNSEKSFFFGDNLISEGTPQHAGIFVIKSKSGVLYFLNRINTGEPVTLNTLEQINNYYKDIIERNKNLIPGLNISDNPEFYK